MRPSPHPSWPWISSAVYYEKPAAAIDWLCEAFGFEVRLKVEGEDGRIEHSELTYGGGVIMIASTDKQLSEGGAKARSPRALDGANTQSLCLYVDDVDAHCARARAAGAEVVREPKTDDYGEDYGAHRSYGARDLEGHHWWFMRAMQASNES